MLQTWFKGLIHNLLADPATPARIMAFIDNLNAWFAKQPQTGPTPADPLDPSAKAS